MGRSLVTTGRMATLRPIDYIKYCTVCTEDCLYVQYESRIIYSFITCTRGPRASRSTDNLQTEGTCI